MYSIHVDYYIEMLIATCTDLDYFRMDTDIIILFFKNQTQFTAL